MLSVNTKTTFAHMMRSTFSACTIGILWDAMGSDSMAAQCVNSFLVPTYQRPTQGCTNREYRFSSLRYGPIGNQTHSTGFCGV